MGAVGLDVGLLRRRRDFGLLVAGQVVSNAGSFLTVVALPFQVYALTHSSLAVGYDHPARRPSSSRSSAWDCSAVRWPTPSTAAG